MAAALLGSADAGRLSPWRKAFRAERALPAAVLGPVLLAAFAAERSFPSAVFGPVLLRPLALFAATLAAVIIRLPQCACSSFVLTSARELQGKFRPLHHPRSAGEDNLTESNRHTKSR
jgi:hypothetical protein